MKYNKISVSFRSGLVLCVIYIHSPCSLVGRFSFATYESWEEVGCSVVRGRADWWTAGYHTWWVLGLLVTYGTLYSIFNSTRQWDSSEGPECVSGASMCFKDYLLHGGQVKRFVCGAQTGAWTAMLDLAFDPPKLWWYSSFYTYQRHSIQWHFTMVLSI